MRNVVDLIPNIDALPERQRSTYPEIQSDQFWRLYDICSKYSMLHVTGFYNLYQSVNYIIDNDIAGDFIECGCFLGGASIFMWHTSMLRGAPRTIRLFDTFAGFSPDEEDEFLGMKQPGSALPDFEAAVVANITEAEANVSDFIFTRGKVEDTLVGFRPDAISILRLDTDFYTSTKVELETLYPALSPGGVLIVDDYGVYKGSRQATDEFLAATRPAPLLNRIGIGIWAGVKPG